MALESTTNIIRPGQDGGTGAIDALHIEQYTGILHETFERKSVLKPFIPVRSVTGTSVIQSYAVGDALLQKLVPGTTPDGSVEPVFGKNTLTIDTVILARNIFPLLEVWQTQYDARAAVGREHGKKFAKFIDQAFFIQAIKAGLRTTSKYTGVDGHGHTGGSQVTLGGSSDHLDPGKLLQAIIDLLVKMQEKDVDPVTDDVMIVVKPREFGTLLQNEQLINTQYKTAAGTSVDTWVLKTYGVPVLSSNNYPGGSTISSHFLSNAANSNAYDGDFTKQIAVAVSPQALLAGETIPITTAVFWDEKSKMWFVDAHTAFGVTPDRAEYSGVIQLP